MTAEQQILTEQVFVSEWVEFEAEVVHSAPCRRPPLAAARDVTELFPRIAAGVGGCWSGREWTKLPVRADAVYPEKTG